MEHTINKASPRDFFMYLLSNAALYYCAGWLVSLLYDYINYSVGSMDYYGSGLPVMMRWAIASLVVVFPLYIVITRSLNRDVALHPEKRDLRVRKWLMYLALSLSSIALVIDIVALLNQFLAGEFAMTFFLKVLSVAIVAGLVFLYYFYELRRDAGKPAPQYVWFRSMAIGIVAATVVGGFFVIGSPTEARNRAYDAQRVSDLQNIQYQIARHFQYKQQLPASLEDITDLIADYSAPMDPETGLPYEYKKTNSSLTFEICANFTTEKLPEDESFPRMGFGVDYWFHGVGRTCFTRTIDPDLYPPIK